jgi:hypothetical protein
MAFVPLAARAAEITVHIGLDRAEVSLNEPFSLTVTVAGTLRSIPEPKIGGLSNFTVAGTPGSSSQFSMINGQVSISKSTTYLLLPNREGEQSIGPAVVEIGGKTYQSNTVTVRVLAAGAASPGAQASTPPAQSAPGRQAAPAQAEGPEQGASSAPDGSVFIRSSVDRKEVYIGDQVTCTFGFYNRVRLVQNPDYTPPTFNGFWVEQIDNNAVQSNREVRGIVYSVQELRYALFPTIEGEATISPASLGYVVSDIWDFFDRGRRVTLQTQPIKVKVNPLPTAGRPSDFNGAVGNYSISAQVDKNSVKQGEAITLNVVIAGRGNIKTLQEPVLPSLSDFDIYESKSEESIDRSSGSIGGKKIFRYVIVPRKAGDYTLPGVSFSYFEPLNEKYVSLKTDDISFTVQPGEPDQQAPSYRLAPEKVLSLGEDIHYIKEDPSVLRQAEPPLFDRASFWLLQFLPLFSVGLALLYRRHRGRLLSDIGYARLRRSRRRLERELKTASRELDSGRYGECYAALDRGLTNFIGDKLNLETQGMVTDRIIDLLAVRNIGQDLREETRQCLEHFAFARFAPQQEAQDQAKTYLDRVRKLTDSLDRAI